LGAVDSGSCLVGGGSARFSRFYLLSGYYSYYASQGKRGLASIIDLLYTSSALERVGRWLGALYRVELSVRLKVV